MRASLVRTPNRSVIHPPRTLAQVLIATSFRAASSQQTQLSTCLGALSKLGEMSSSCGDDDDDADHPRTGTTCASDACVGFIASVTDVVVQDMSTGFASCTGDFAGHQLYADEAYLTIAVRDVASACDLTSALTPLSLSTSLPTFVYHSEPATWTDARAVCQAEGGDLASIHTETENAEAYELSAGWPPWF